MFHVKAIWLSVEVSGFDRQLFNGFEAMSDRVRPAGPAESLDGEFDPGSGRTLAARLTHASRT
jgi:hypothetical protein